MVEHSRRACSSAEGSTTNRTPSGSTATSSAPLLVAGSLSSARGHALSSLLAPNGLLISEAFGAEIDQLGLERGHRTLVVHRKGGKTLTIPLAPGIARAVDLAAGERFDGPIFLGHNGERMTRDAATRVVRRLARAAGVTKLHLPLDRYGLSPSNLAWWSPTANYLSQRAANCLSQRAHSPRAGPHLRNRANGS